MLLSNLYKYRFVSCLVPVILVLTGCANAVLTQVYPDGGYIILEYGNPANEYKVQMVADSSCRSRGLGVANIGSRMGPGPLGNTYFRFTCYSTSQVNALRTDTSQSAVFIDAQNPKGNINIDEAKRKCSDLGFRSNSEQFGKCVLQLSK